MQGTYFRFTKDDDSQKHIFMSNVLPWLQQQSKKRHLYISHETPAQKQDAQAEYLLENPSSPTTHIEIVYTEKFHIYVTQMDRVVPPLYELTRVTSRLVDVSLQNTRSQAPSVIPVESLQPHTDHLKVPCGVFHHCGAKHF